MAPGPARDAAQAQLTSMEREARARAERPDNAATPEAQRPSAGEYLRAPTAFLAGVGTGLVSGFLGPGGVAAQAVLDQKVDANATPSEKFAFGLGQELAGAFHMVEGREKVAAGGVAEGATAGVATPIAAPVAIVGAAEAAAGAGLAAASGQPALPWLS